jgi:RimJ/RimL family protein N-acetyltransferase
VSERTGIPTLTTERLVLRPFARTDAADLQQLAGAYEVASTTLTIPHPYERAMAEDWIATHRAAFQRGEQVVVAITSGATGALMGAIGPCSRSRTSARPGLLDWRAVRNRGYCGSRGGCCATASRTWA